MECQWNLPRRTELIQFLSLNKYDLIFLQESLLSSDSTFHIPSYKTLKKNRSMTRRGTTDSTENLENLTYSPLSTQQLSSLDPSSTYLAITVKIKGTSPIHLLNIYVTPICFFFFVASVLTPFHPSFYLCPYYLYFWQFYLPSLILGLSYPRGPIKQRFV